MRILISGGTGVIGRRVVPMLLDRGHAVSVITRSNSGSSIKAARNLQVVHADLFDPQSLRRAAEGHDTLINLATHMPATPMKMMFRSGWALNDRIRAEGVSNLVDAALDAGIERFVQESFALAYPDRGADWIEETQPLSPADYDRTVLDAERSIARFSTASRTGVILRFAAFYGPDAMQVATYIKALRMGWAVLPGERNSYFSSVSHDDAAAAVVAAIDIPSGAYNITDDEPMTHEAYFEALARALHLSSPRYLPSWTTPLFGVAGSTMARSLRISNRKFKSAANWQPAFPSVISGWPAVISEMASSSAR